MPKVRKLLQAEASSLLYPFTPARIKQKLEQAYKEGALVQMVQSSFKDPGSDYNAVTINGVEVWREDGY
jgi:hypothetical protein